MGWRRMTTDGTRSMRIPNVAVRRLPVYLRVLTALNEQGVEIVSSAELSRHTGYSSEQIRKDLAYFGAFGTRGVGYNTQLLIQRIRSILGLDRPLAAVIVGAGNLGTALARYNIVRDRDIKIKAIFDTDPSKVGQQIEGVPVYDAEHMDRVIRQQNLKLAILTVPGSFAQQVADQLVAAGIRAILNFAPVNLSVPDDVYVQDIDLSLELQSLAYYVAGAAAGDRSRFEDEAGT